MPDLSVPSGAIVSINIAPISESMALKGAIAKEVSGSNLSFDYDPLKGITEQSFDAAVIAKIVALIDSSQSVSEALLMCLKRCTYNGEKITLDTFEPQVSRGDYYPIIIECLKENLTPFFEGLLSQFKPSVEAVMSMRNVKKEEAQK